MTMKYSLITDIARLSREFIKYISGDGRSKETELVMERKYSDNKKLCSYCKQELPTDSFTKVTVARFLKGKQNVR